MTMLDFLWYFVLIPLLVISFIICIHELGHYYVARWFNTAIKSFSIGFGTPLFATQDRRGTVWKISNIPLGGFVSFYEKGDVDDGEKPNGILLSDQAPWKRIAVSLGGPLANFILAIAIFGFFAFAYGKPVQQITIENVLADSAAERAGLLAGDVVKEVDGRKVLNSNTFRQKIAMSSNETLALTVMRVSSLVTVSITPERVVVDNGLGGEQAIGRIGVEFSPELVETKRFGPIGAIAEGVKDTFDTISTSANMLGRIFRGKESVHSLSGPVGMANVVGGTTKQTLELEDVSLGQRAMITLQNLLLLSAYISVGVGFINLLPIPMFDGGRVVIDAYALVTGSSPSESLGLVMNLSIVFVAFMVLLITVGDFQEAGVLEIFSSM